MVTSGMGCRSMSALMSHGDVLRACTGMRIMDHPDVNEGGLGAVIWYDALEDRYEVISRSLAPPTESPLPPPYMPNRCVENLFT
jgi:hypothetical protein